jgi:hypothetical protein
MIEGSHPSGWLGGWFREYCVLRVEYPDHARADSCPFYNGWKSSRWRACRALRKDRSNAHALRLVEQHRALLPLLTLAHEDARRGGQVQIIHVELKRLSSHRIYEYLL